MSFISKIIYTATRVLQKKNIYILNNVQ
jgi:hypothetical protein